jgi:phage repressor protein C with HTH and peptisase S24 domain
MTRTLLALAVSAFAAMTVFASTAQACISCEYVPPVVNTPVHSFHGKTYKKKRHYRATKSHKRKSLEAHKARKAKKHIAKSKPAAAPKKVEKAETTKKVPVNLKAANENSSISTAAVNDTGSIEEAKSEPRTEEAKADAGVGCKKFFPSVGMTLSVPCQ